MVKIASIRCPKYMCKGIFSKPFARVGMKIICPYCNNWFTIRKKDFVEVS